MSSKVIVKNINSCYSELTVFKSINNSFLELKADPTISKHIVSNNGFFPLIYWINFFENKY